MKERKERVERKQRKEADERNGKEGAEERKAFLKSKYPGVFVAMLVRLGKKEELEEYWTYCKE